MYSYNRERPATLTNITRYIITNTKYDTVTAKYLVSERTNFLNERTYNVKDI